MKESLWRGRQEPQGHRYFQVVTPWNKDASKNLGRSPFDIAAHERSIVLAGFASDEGVRRNGGRPGAALGPDAFRGQLAKLPYRPKVSFFDAGDVTCVGHDLESASHSMARLAEDILSSGSLPILIGGGHEIAWSSYQGAISHCRREGKRLGIINFDAHFDLRDLVNDQGNSGTPFHQAAMDAKAHHESFHYLVLGIQPLSNHDQLFQRALSLGVHHVNAASLHESSTREILMRFINDVDALYVTICLDVLSQAIAPGVSAPQPLGIFPQDILRIMKPIVQSRKILLMDVAELCPPHDGHVDATGNRSHDTARVAAALVASILESIYCTLPNP